MNPWAKKRMIEEARKRKAIRDRVKKNKDKNKAYLEIMKENAEFAREYFKDEEEEKKENK